MFVRVLPLRVLAYLCFLYVCLQKWIAERTKNPDLITYDDCVKFPQLERALIKDLIAKGKNQGTCERVVHMCVLVHMLSAYARFSLTCTCPYVARVRASLRACTCSYTARVRALSDVCTCE